jgi:hypothetical protein
MDQHWLETMHSQHALASLSDRPGQFRQNPMRALFDQAQRAQSGQDEGLDYLHMPF